MNAFADATRRDTLLQTARRLRAEGRLVEALGVLDRLETAFPTFSRLFLERGQLLVALRDAPAAVAALQGAVRLNPTLPSAWDMLAQLYQVCGDTVRASEAAQRVSVLQALPPEVVMAHCLLADGDLDPATEVIDAFLRQHPVNVGALCLAARIRLEAGEAERAEVLLRQALTLAPDDLAARYDLVMTLLSQEKYAPAKAEADRLLARDPHNRDYLKQSALAAVGLGDLDAAIGLYDRLLAATGLSSTEIADLRYWRANALKTVGRLEDAILEYRAALAERPDNGVVWFSLANLKTYRFLDDEIAQMEAVRARPDMMEKDLIYLGFALGKAYEDRRDFDASWRRYDQANAIRRRTSTHRADVADACAERLRRIFTPAFFAERQGGGADDPAPIFVLGLPRSGSTLVEQILASHSQVEGTQELIEIDRMVAEVCDRDPDCRLPVKIDAVSRLSPDKVLALGRRYLSETRAYRRLDHPRFIDKMPNNFWHVGFIHLILPKASIIDVRREPMASGFSNLKQLYGGANHDYAYGQESFARRYRTYLDVMRGWDEVLPGRVLRVHYEDLVEDLESGVRRLLHYCGLPFEASCLSFHQTQRSVRTPSSEQVRQPIGRQGLDQWRAYEPYLGPLRAVLGDALTRYRD